MWHFLYQTHRMEKHYGLTCACLLSIFVLFFHFSLFCHNCCNKVVMYRLTGVAVYLIIVLPFLVLT